MKISTLLSKIILSKILKETKMWCWKNSCENFISKKLYILNYYYIETSLSFFYISVIWVYLKQRFLNCGLRPKWSQSEMLGSRKFNSDTLHQDLICYATKIKYIRLIKTWFSFINFCILETNPKTTSFHVLFTKQINYLWENIYFYI